MTELTQLAALEVFDKNYVGLSKGALSVALTVTNNARNKNFPLDSNDFLTPSGGQVSGMGGSSVIRVLRQHGIERRLSSEGGRTSRGSIERMRLYVDLLNQLSLRNDLDLIAAEKFWIGRVLNYFDSMPFLLKLDPGKSIRSCIRNLFEQAIERQREATGTMYAGAIMQHLVGAKLKIVFPEVFVFHGFSVADGPTNRTADFSQGDAAVHVTTAPSMALMEKCVRNLSVGLRPIIVTTQDGAGGARAIAIQLGIEDRVDVIEIEQFLISNIYERGGLERQSRSEFVRRLVDSYNGIVAEAESDPSLRIELED